MNHFDPDKIESDLISPSLSGTDGRRQLASHYYPLVGPYDSNDPHLLEYQVLLMKFSGIDGVIVDWYGVEDYFDYAQLHRNTLHLIEYIKKAGLSFAICYEDQTVKHMVDGGVFGADRASGHGKEVMGWMQDNWFGDEAYVKVEGRPLLLVFGPQYFDAGQWREIFAGIEPRPYFHTLNTVKAGADGAFGWPPVHGGDITGPAEWLQYLERLYSGEAGNVIGAVFPQFYDIYQQAGLHPSYGHLDDMDGTVFGQTLELAQKNATHLTQIITWNDYGEGTMIEPTVEFGYRYVEEIQENQRGWAGTALDYGPADLRLPVLLYQLRQWGPNDPVLQAKLDAAAGFLFADDIEAGRAILLDIKGARDH
jgi:hypothetical protein